MNRLNTHVSSMIVIAVFSLVVGHPGFVFRQIRTKPVASEKVSGPDTSRHAVEMDQDRGFSV